MKLWSDSFRDGEAIPVEFAFARIDPKLHVALAPNRNPHLAWWDVPGGTRSIALLCHDFDAPGVPDDVNHPDREVPTSLAGSTSSTGCWSTCARGRVDRRRRVLRRGRAEGQAGPETKHGARHGLNDYTAWFSQDHDMAGEYFGYDGPCPPWNDALIHRYQFAVHALDIERLPVTGRFNRCAGARRDAGARAGARHRDRQLHAESAARRRRAAGGVTGVAAVELVLVRHGETAWNRDRRIQGQLDTPLNDEGLRQARAAARRLAIDARRARADGAAPIALVTSDLLRCRQTAEPIAAALGVEPSFDARLRERHFGVFQGRTFTEILRDDATRAARWQARDPDLEVEGGESLRVFARRAEDALASLAAAHAGRTLVVVTHGGVLDVAHRLARGLPLEAPRDFEIANASLNRLRFDGVRFELVAWGDVSHWQGALDEL